MKTLEYQKLIDEFAKLPKQERQEETLISIIRGKAHDEKVSSNILAFFFDTTREHNLGDLFMKSLLETIEYNSQQYSNDYWTETEYHTEEGNFIDIIIHNEDINIIIENKILATLNNNLKDYYETIYSKYKKTTIGIVLSLYPITDEDIKKYVNEKLNEKIFDSFEDGIIFIKKNYHFITYEEFFSQLKINTGNYISNISTKYLPLFLDYINNIENIKKYTKMDKEMIDFIKKNEENIMNLEQETSNLRNEMREKINGIKEILENDIKDKNSKIWAYRNLPQLFDDIVVDLYPQKDKKLEITLDSYLKLSGWEFHLWIRKNTSRTKVTIQEIIDTALHFKYNELKEGEYIGRFEIKTEEKYQYDTDIRTIATYIADIINKIDEYCQNQNLTSK